MLIIELKFPAGRYHATPWGRNVNEGVPEWPPSPYRLARALIDTWKRRMPEWSEGRFQPILSVLSPPPLFYLPPALPSHTRSYLSSNEKDINKKQLIFDAFITLGKDQNVLMGFDQDLAVPNLNDLNLLLSEMNYLGRSESWIKAKIAEEIDSVEWNCLPSSSAQSGSNSELIRVACFASPDSYDQQPNKPKKDWVEALSMSSRDCLKEGWSDPPALKWVDYQRPAEYSRPLVGRKPSLSQKRFRFAKFALHSKVLPRIQETVPFAERVRGHLMGIHKRIQDDDPAMVSPLFSGKDPNGRPLRDHPHAFYLPLDEDGDGRLDHLLVWASTSFDQSELMALDRLRSVWQTDGRPDVTFVLVSLSADNIGKKSSSWVSATPFMISRHYRKGRGPYENWLVEEVIKECRFHGIPVPTEIKWIPKIVQRSRSIYWFEFTRRKKDPLHLRTYGCSLKFDQPVNGPFSIGAGCHFGMGLFVPFRA
jgi:CRISPR-associated protein Csb2